LLGAVTVDGVRLIDNVKVRRHRETNREQGS
jgi:hypothetical protein